MRTKLIQELKETILSQIGISFNKQYRDTFYTTIPTENEDPFAEDYDLRELFNKDGVIAIAELEFGNVYITGLTPEEQKYLEEGF